MKEYDSNLAHRQFRCQNYFVNNYKLCTTIYVEENTILMTCTNEMLTYIANEKHLRFESHSKRMYIKFCITI